MLSPSVCWLVCAFPLITCAIITSCTLLLCDFILVDLAALSTGVATMSSLAQLQVSDIEKQCRRKADREWKCQKAAVTRDAYRAANCLRMAARRALVQRPGWLIRYEIFLVSTTISSEYHTPGSR